MTQDQEDQELVMALLQCEDDWQRADMLALYGHHDKADALRDQYAEEHLNQILDHYRDCQLRQFWQTQMRVAYHLHKRFDLPKEKAPGKPAP